MNERKFRIARFVESIGSEKMSGSVLFGGTANDEEPPVKKNYGGCTNLDSSCVKSENTGRCENNLGMCGGTTNGANCIDKDLSERVNADCP